MCDINLQIHLDEILPSRGAAYNIDEVEEIIKSHQNQVELEQHKYNDQFDEALDPETSAYLKGLHSKISQLQLAILKIQCDISYVKEQYYAVQSIKQNPIIKERYEMLTEEHKLKQNLRQLKFKPILDFFELYVSYLETCIKDGRRLCSLQSAITLFDWTQYHHIVLLLRACGKTLIDIEKFERLYQSCDAVSITFKQPLETIQFNNFIEFYDSFSLESQLVVTVEPGKAQANTEDHLFDIISARMTTVTVDCCRLLLEVNMSYIDAHLTDGINIDKLNGIDSGSIKDQEDGALPLYALSPQEYITQIGQHLLTLRKRTEVFDVTVNVPLIHGLKCLQQAQDIPIDVDSYRTATEIIMRCIARHCIRSLLGRTNNSILSKLTMRGKRQLATDTLYLDNVLEDLRLLDPSEPNISKFKSLLSQ